MVYDCDKLFFDRTRNFYRGHWHNTVSQYEEKNRKHILETRNQKIAAVIKNFHHKKAVFHKWLFCDFFVRLSKKLEPVHNLFNNNETKQRTII